MLPTKNEENTILLQKHIKVDFQAGMCISMNTKDLLLGDDERMEKYGHVKLNRNRRAYSRYGAATTPGHHKS